MTRYCYPDTIQCSTPPKLTTPLYLNIFRGEPAISGFDWHITPKHRSSHIFAAMTGSGLPLPLGWVHPVHAQLTRFRVIRLRQNCSIRACFHYASTTEWFRQSRISDTHRFILQQARYHSRAARGQLVGQFVIQLISFKMYYIYY